MNDFGDITDVRDTRRAFRYDYCMFLQDAYWDILKRMYAAMKQAEAETAVLADHLHLMTRLDPTRAFETCDILACHGRNLIWWDLYASSNAKLYGKHLASYEGWPVTQEEIHRGGDQRAFFVSEMKYTCRKQLSDQDVQFICFPYTSQTGWTWRQGQWGHIPTDYTLLNYFAAAIPAAIARIKPLEKVLVRTHKAPSELLVVFPRVSYIHAGWAHRKDSAHLVNLLHKAGRAFEYRSEARIAEGREDLSAYKVVIYPFGPFLTRAMTDKLLAWVRGGGLLVGVGPLGLFDEYGFEDGRLMQETVGATPRVKGEYTSAPWNYDWPERNAKGPLLTRPCGKGTVAFLTRSFANFIETPNQFARLLAVIDKQAPQPARSEGDVFEFWPMEDESGQPYLGVLNANPDEDTTAKITLREPYSKVTDLDIPGGFPVTAQCSGGKTSFTLRLQPAGMTVLKLDR